MMRSLFRGILGTVAAAALVVGMVVPAFANTNLVPASRLIAPFFDISSGRDTFYLLTNVSNIVNLNQVTFTDAIGNTLGPWGVHLEHYGQSCGRVDESDRLTPSDIDQFDLGVSTSSIVASSIGAGQAIGPVTASATQSGVAGRGWSDIDVRFGSGTLTSSTSIQANVLMGTVVITDSVADFALAYPMASIIGTNYGANTSGGFGGIGGAIVTRGAFGFATNWSGRYEPLPARLLVPAFFAEGTDSSGPNAGQLFSAFLAIAGPPDGNWSGSGNGEAPGQQTSSTAIANLALNFIIFDGCEVNFSTNLVSHYLNNFYANLFGGTTNRSTWSTAKCGVAFGGRDELSGQAVGWMDITQNNVSAGVGSSCTTFPTSSATLASPGTGVCQPRGLVGITIENVSGTGIVKGLGDVTRLWGDASPWGAVAGAFAFNAKCVGTSGGSTQVAFGGSNAQGPLNCFYSLVDRVNHNDTGQNGALCVSAASGVCASIGANAKNGIP